MRRVREALPSARGYSTATRWKGSPYPFKSPHLRGHMGRTFNDLSRMAGDAGVVAPRWQRRQKATGDLSTQVVSMMEAFAQLPDYTSLESLEDVLPLHYVFLLPARQGSSHSRPIPACWQIRRTPRPSTGS